MSRLDLLLRPKSIAVIGGGTWCENVIEQCRKIGFAGQIWPVHPKRTQMEGLTSYADIESLPSAPDATFIGVNRDATIEIVRDLSERGSGGAVCFASGFREAVAQTTDGADKQAALLQAAGQMPILGPNCYGLLNYLDGVALWPDQHGGERVETGVAIVTQSSNIAINLTMQRRGLPLAYVVTAGNQAQTGVATIARTLLADPRVTAVALHIEGIDDPRGYEAMAMDAARAGKPVIALKIGASKQARSATVSHTASMAGSNAGAHAFFDRLGIGRVSSLASMLETLKLLHVSGPLASNRIASMSCSGGEASLMADAAHTSKVTYPPLTKTQHQALQAVLGPAVALANPLDYHTHIWGDTDALARTFTSMMEADLALGCVVLDFPRSDRCDASAWEPVITALTRTQAETQRPMAIVASLPDTMPEAVALRLISLGIIPFSGMTEAIEAIETAAWMGRMIPSSVPLLLPETIANTRALSEKDAKDVLAGYGVRVPNGTSVHTPAEAARTAASIGFPVVLKGSGFAHKTEAGAVALGLRTKTEVYAAAVRVPGNAFLIEEMVKDPVAELLVGVVMDPAHGYLLTLAAGGVLTELLDDRVSLLIPASRADVEKALSRLKVSRVLSGYRGKHAANIEAVINNIMALQTYVQAERPVEVEINPMICTPESATAVDALITIGENP